MKVNREEFLKKLNQIQPGIAANAIVEQSHCFVFVDGFIKTYNDEIAVSVPFDIGITCAVTAKELYALLSKLKDEEIDISEKDAHLIIKGRKTRSGITKYSEIKLPIDDIEIKGKWKALPEKFNEALSFNLFSISKDMSMPILNYAHIIGNVIESTDNYRITSYGMDKEISDELFISYKTIPEVLKYEMTHYQTSDGWIHFKAPEGLVFSCRTIADDYPDLTDHLKVKGTSVKLPQIAVSEAIERCRIFTTAEKALDEVITITLTNGHFKISAKSQEGWLRESGTAKFVKLPEEEEISFQVNPGFLLQILKHHNRLVVGESKLQFKTDEMLHVISLLAD